MRLSLLVGIVFLAAAPAVAQPTVSIDFQGPTPGGIDGFGIGPITSADILTTAPPGPPGPNPLAPGPLPPPGIEVGGAAGAAGAIPGGLGIAPSFCPGIAELDALSYGRDVGNTLVFSVDEFALGVPGPAPPDVFSEGIAGAAEASADGFLFLGPVAPFPPGPVIGNTAIADGDGLAPNGFPGSGLVEPNPPGVGIPDPGDNLDALDMDTTFVDLTGPIFFSLDSGFPEPIEGPPANCATAAANGFSGADVLVSFAGAAAPALAIPAVTLGLDLAGFDTDDLDALVFDDADGSLTLTAVDTVYFSVRRGSAVIGAPDSAFGVPIEAGDILTLPAGPPGTPAIFIAAEGLGLATARAGSAGPFGPDDLDALDVFKQGPAVPSMGAWGRVVLLALMFGAPLLAVRLRRGAGG